MASAPKAGVDTHSAALVTVASEARPEQSAARSGVRLGAAAFVSLASNYLFLLAAGRLLGSADYSTVAALAGVLTVVLLPTGALQMAVSREVSRLDAVGDGDGASAFARGILGFALKLTAPVLVLALLLAVPIRELLNVGETGPVLVALLAVVVALVYPVALGVIQGYQEFGRVALGSAAPMIARLILFAALALAGLRLYGALAAMTVSALAGGAMTLWMARSYLGRSLTVERPSLRPFFRYLGPVVLGLFAISVLTNADILIVKARFSAHEAGVYAAASAFARVAFFLPATLLAILFPRAAARHARGEQSGDILGRSLLCTVAFCGLLTGGYAAIGGPLVRLTYGSDFRSATGLLVPFCLAMTLFSLANVLVGYHLSRGDSRYARALGVGVVAQVGLLATVPSSLHQVLWIDAAIAAGLLVVHELLMGSSAPAIRDGLSYLGVAAWPRAGVARLAAARAKLVETIVVLLGYGAVAVAFTWPLAAQLHSRMLGPFPNDGSGTAAFFWEARHESGYGFFGSVHHVLTGAPLGWDQGNALNFQWLWPYYPTYLLSGPVGEVAAINLCILAGFVLSAAAMYALVRWLGCGRLVATWAGLVYMIFPWHLQRAIGGAASLVHIEVFPLLLMAAIAWVRRPTEKSALLVALAVTGAWLTSGYFGTMALTSLIPVAIVGAVASYSKDGWLRTVRRSLILWGTSLVGTGLVAVMAFAAGGTAGIAIGRTAGDLGAFGGHLRDYLPAPVHSLSGTVASHLDPRLASYPGAETPLYPGLLTVGLAVVALFGLRRSRISRSVVLAMSVCAGMVVVAVAFATPDPINLFGISVHPSPSYLLFKLVPSFRVPLRFCALLMTALVPLAALGLARVYSWIGRNAMPGTRRWIFSGGVFAAVCAVSLVELSIFPMPSSRVDNVPVVYSALDRVPQGTLVEYPLAPSGFSSNSEYVYWQRVHGRRLLNGANAFTATDSVRRMLVDPGAPGTARALAALGVTAVITRSTTHNWGLDSQLPNDDPSYGPGYRLVARFPGDVRLWRVDARPAPAVSAYRQGDFREPDPSVSDGRVSLQTGRLLHVDIYSRAAAAARLNLNILATHGASGTIVAWDGKTRLMLPLRNGRIRMGIVVPAGHSIVVLRITSDQLSGEALLSTPWVTEGSAGTRALHPAVISVSSGL